PSRCSCFCRLLATGSAAVSSDGCLNGRNDEVACGTVSLRAARCVCSSAGRALYRRSTLRLCSHHPGIERKGHAKSRRCVYVHDRTVHDRTRALIYCGYVVLTHGGSLDRVLRPRRFPSLAAHQPVERGKITRPLRSEEHTS